MTDKQIKDGIDVSQCECYSVEDNSCNDTLSGSCMKEKCQIFRLLRTIKSKEQELNDYKKQFKADTKEMEDYQNEIARHLQSIEYLYNQTEAKEQECEKLYIQLKADEEYHKEEENTLRKIIKNKEERNIELYKENNKLKQTLTEIKEIALGVRNYLACPSPRDVRYEMDIILQKISECEVENA